MDNNCDFNLITEVLLLYVVPGRTIAGTTSNDETPLQVINSVTHHFGAVHTNSSKLQQMPRAFQSENKTMLLGFARECNS